MFDEVDEVKLLQEAGRIGVWLHGVCVEAGVHCGLHDLIALVAQCELELVYSVQHDGIVDTLATALAHSATFTVQQQQVDSKYMNSFWCYQQVVYVVLHMFKPMDILCRIYLV